MHTHHQSLLPLNPPIVYICCRSSSLTIFVIAADSAFPMQCRTNRNGHAPAETHHDLPPELLQRIKSSDSELTRLDLSCKMCFREEGCRILARVLALNTCITGLNFNNTSLDPAGARLLIPAFTHLTAMTYLNFWGTRIGPAGAVLLCSALTHLTALTFLELGSAGLDDSCTEALSRALSLNTRITSLSIGGKSICGARLSADGVLSLLPALTRLTAMSSLNLYGTGIGPAGAVLLCGALAHLTALTDLDLMCNGLTADDGAHICGAAAAAGMTRLRRLAIDIGTNGNFWCPSYASEVVACASWRQLTLPHTPDEINHEKQRLGSSLDCAPLVSYLASQRRLRHTMSLVLRAAATFPLFCRRSECALRLQPPCHLGIAPSQRWLDLHTPQLFICSGSTQRLHLLCCCCPLSTVAFRLARSAGRHEGRRASQRAAVALIMRRCFGDFVWRFWTGRARDACFGIGLPLFKRVRLE